MDTTTTNIVPSVCTDWTNNNFDENWLPGISFNNKDDILMNPKENQAENAIMNKIATTVPLHQNQSRQVTPLASPAKHHTFQSPSHRAGESHKHVRFACHEFLETCHAPPRISVLKEEEIRTLWWQTPELLQMKRFTRSLMMTRNTEDWVGLDRFTTERTAYKKRAVRLVLLAQHQQRTHAISDNPEEFLRAVSRRCSHWTRNMALNVGRYIHHEINAIERNERPTPANGLEGIPAPAVSMEQGLNSTMGSSSWSSDDPYGSHRKRSRFEIDEAYTNFDTTEGRRVLQKR